jgi:FG-GAP repeat
VGTGAVGSSYQGSGVCMSADGALMFSGGPGDSSTVGAVWIFILNIATGVYVQKGSKLTASPASSNFGFAVALSLNGSTLAVGAYGEGATYAFTLNGGQYLQQGKFYISTTSPSIHSLNSFT